MGTTLSWPSARDFAEAIQDPPVVFLDPSLKSLTPALDRFELPVIASGNFACVCRMYAGGDSFAVRFFTRDPGDKEKRYQLIDGFVSRNNLQCLPEFFYKPNELLIRGQRYPVIKMDWIDGASLDRYVQENLSKPETLRFVSEQWTSLVNELERAGIAHGDLQHGNILIDSTGLRLVDLDSLYVPEMKGMYSCENGHPAYQHPKRSALFFNDKLDRFSSLVIYASLMGLATNPALWSQFHDDNLILKRQDYLDPYSSKLLKALREMRGEVGTVTEALVHACLTNPDAVPSLSQLVTKKSALPPWMRDVPEIQVVSKSRAVHPGDSSSTWKPFARDVIQVEKPSPAGTSQPSSVIPPQATPASTASPSQVQPSLLAKLNWQSLYGEVWSWALGIFFVGIFFFWIWYPVLESVLRLTGIIEPRAKETGTTVTAAYIVLCILLGAILALRAQLTSRSRPTTAPSISRYPTSQQGGSYPPPFPPASTPRPAPTHSGSPVVASRIRTKYHRPNCRWAYKIDRRNKVTYTSAAEARVNGLRPCGECMP